VTGVWVKVFPAPPPNVPDSTNPAAAAQFTVTGSINDAGTPVTIAGKNYKYWEFHGNGTITCTKAGYAEHLIVGAGGGTWAGRAWGGYQAGGGGGGGMVEGPGFINLGVTPVIVGQGKEAQNGQSSSVGDYAAPGGGFGGGDVPPYSGADGGSGGGAVGNESEPGNHPKVLAAHGGKGVTGLGNDGAGGLSGGVPGGGGGAGGPAVGKTGGPGKVSNITGTPRTFAKGGSGPNGTAVAVVPNSGNGAQVAGNSPAAPGSSGCVIVRVAV
jgi:hypothetical protein